MSDLERPTLEASAAVVVALLEHEGPQPEVRGIEELTWEQRIGLLVSACANIISHLIAATAEHDCKEALKGLRLLHLDMAENIRTITKEHE
jgi:hypothetical protein